MWSAIPEIERDGYLLKPSQDDLNSIAKYGVISDIHSEDYIFNALYSVCDKDFAATFRTYFRSGNASAKEIRKVTASHIDTERPLAFLDFASGYGCVARHMRNVFPGSHVTAMDIHEHAYWFNKGHLHLDAVVSNVDPGMVKAFAMFDVVFALSFFSHMPRDTQMPWLRKLSEFVKPGGLLLFTTHGETSHRTQMPHIPVQDGFGFIEESEQFDLPTSSYGHAVTYKAFMLKQVTQLDGMSLVNLREGHWWEHQDDYLLRKQV